MIKLVASKVVEGRENSNGLPPFPPYDLDIVTTKVVGGGFGLSGIWTLQPVRHSIDQEFNDIVSQLHFY